MVPSTAETGVCPQKKREIRIDRRIGFFIPNTSFTFETVEKPASSADLK